MSGTEFIVAAIICVLFGCTCYWLGYGYGKDEGFHTGTAKQMKEDQNKLNAYRINLQECQQITDYQSLAIDSMRDVQPPRILTASQIIDLARYRGRDC